MSQTKPKPKSDPEFEPVSMINVIIIDSDPLACDLSMFLIARDFRTRTIGELTNRIPPDAFDSLEKLRTVKKIAENKPNYDYFNINPDLYPDVVILDTEKLYKSHSPVEFIQRIDKWNPAPRVICTTTYPDPNLMKELKNFGCYSGYLVKGELLYSLASAVCLAHKGFFVITPSILPYKGEQIMTISQESNTLVISSPKLHPPKTKNKKLAKKAKEKMDVIRLSVLFSLPTNEIVNELAYPHAAAEISKKYEDLKIKKLVDRKETLENLFNNYNDNGKDKIIDNTRVIDHFQELLDNEEEYKERRKSENGGLKHPEFRSMGTLAFHLQTRIVIVDPNESTPGN